MEAGSVRVNRDVELVEQAMVAIRRRQTRRSLAARAAARDPRAGAATAAAHVDVLDVLEAAEQAGAAVTVSNVAIALSVDQPRASRLVAAAVADGVVRRTADQTDGRRSLLVLTARGRAVVQRVHVFRQSAFAAAMSDWSSTERKEFARLLTRFVDGLGPPPG
jgi:DNA-binding MarR family transcriptional regulator